MTAPTLPPARAHAPGVLDTVIVPRVRDLGEMTVRRALPSRGRRMVGPFIFLDEMGPAEFGPDEGIDVRPHPHIGLATVTYLFEGRITHRDSLGTTQDITPGAVNWMTAGRGITHSERAPDDLRGERKRLSGLQTWLALPTAEEERAPSFEHIPEDALPTLDDRGVAATVIVGHAYGARSPAPVFTDTLYVHADLAPGAVLPLPDDHEDRALYIVSGSIEQGGQTHEPGRLLVFGDGPAQIAGGPQGARVMLVGGAVADGPRHVWWNFVASSKEKIDAAREEWARGDWGRGRFDLPPNDRDEHIPLPDGEPGTKASFVP